MKMSNIMLVGLLTFLILCSAINPVVANSWGDPLATDTTGDGEYIGEDIISVDARYSNGFVDFRFIMNDSTYQWNWYQIFIDLDKNSSTGGAMDIGYDFYIGLEVGSLNPYLEIILRFDIYGEKSIVVSYNMTANNGTATEWTDPSAISNFHILTFLNSTQSDIAFGVNWTWVLQELASEGITSDGSSIYLVYRAGWDTDYCPNQTPADDDYLEWTVAAAGGIPGFEPLFLVLSILSVGAFYMLKKKYAPL